MAQVRYRALWALALMVSGCSMIQGPKPTTSAESMDNLERLVALAEKQGASWSIQATWDGNAELYLKESAGLDSGLVIHAHIQGNAKGD